MKLSDVQIGQRYEASVCGRLIVVRVTSVQPTPSPPWSRTQDAVVTRIATRCKWDSTTT
jgi:hypothetical protein